MGAVFGVFSEYNYKVRYTQDRRSEGLFCLLPASSVRIGRIPHSVISCVFLHCVSMCCAFTMIKD